MEQQAGYSEPALVGIDMWIEWQSDDMRCVLHEAWREVEIKIVEGGKSRWLRGRIYEMR